MKTFDKRSKIISQLYHQLQWKYNDWKSTKFRHYFYYVLRTFSSSTKAFDDWMSSENWVQNFPSRLQLLIIIVLLSLSSLVSQYLLGHQSFQMLIYSSTFFLLQATVFIIYLGSFSPLYYFLNFSGRMRLLH